MFRSRLRLFGLTLLGLTLILLTSFPLNGVALEKRIITLYQNGPAGIVRRETVEFQEGLNELTRYLPGKARSNTIFLDSPGATLKSVKIEPSEKGESGLLEERIGKYLEVRQTSEESWVEGTLVDIVDGKPLLKTPSNRFRLVRKPEEYRFDDSPLREAGNRLDIKYLAEKEGKTSLTLGYQLSDLSWSPQYVGFLSEKSKILRLRGTAYIENDTAWDFDRSELYLLAGSPAREKEERRMFAASNVSQQETESPEKVFEYYRYSVDSPLTLEAGDRTMVGFMKSRQVDYRRYYEFEPSVSSAVRSFLVLENEEERGLGLPLASGPIRIYEDNKDRTFLGADSLSKLPKGSSAELELGKTFDLEGERTRMEHEKLDENHWRDRVRVTLKNGKNSTEEVRVIEKLPGSWEIKKSSRKYERIDSNRVLFEVEVPEERSVEVTYTVEYRY